MDVAYLTAPTVTGAERVKRTLDRAGIGGRVIRLSAGLAPHGCAFGVEIARKEADAARSALRRAGVDYGRLVLGADGREYQQSTGFTGRPYTRTPWGGEQ